MSLCPLSSDWGKVHTILLQFLPPDQYTGKCLLTPQFVLRYVERNFVPAVARAYAKAMKLNQNIK